MAMNIRPIRPNREPVNITPMHRRPKIPPTRARPQLLPVIAMIAPNNAMREKMRKTVPQTMAAPSKIPVGSTLPASSAAMKAIAAEAIPEIAPNSNITPPIMRFSIIIPAL
jgi:hypothetical protein